MTPRAYRINSSKVAHETFENEAILINLDSGTYYSLNETGARIWALLETSPAVEEIIAAIAAGCEPGAASVASAVELFLEELRKDDLIVPDGAEAERPAIDISDQKENGDRDKRQPFQPPCVTRYTDMQELLLLDPIHDVDAAGWPTGKPGASNQ